MIHTISSREFTRDVAAAKQWAAEGPVVITDRGQPAHVLLTIDDYQLLLDGADGGRSLFDAMQALPETGDIDMDLPARSTAGAARIPDFGA